MKNRTVARSVVLIAATLVASTLLAQGPAPAPGGGQPIGGQPVGGQQGGGQQGGAPAGRGRGAAPPPAPQAGHPSGKLVIWGDTALFDGRQNPDNCILMSRFKRGTRMGFRMTAIDGGTGETENTATVTGHLTYNSKTKGKVTLDIPMRWRGGAGPNAPVPNGYLRVPLELWTGFWVVPDDAETGMVTYTMTATDAFGRTASFRQFPDIGSQTYVVD